MTWNKIRHPSFKEYLCLGNRLEGYNSMSLFHHLEKFDEVAETRNACRTIKLIQETYLVIYFIQYQDYQQPISVPSSCKLQAIVLIHPSNNLYIPVCISLMLVTTALWAKKVTLLMKGGLTQLLTTLKTKAGSYLMDSESTFSAGKSAACNIFLGIPESSASTYMYTKPLRIVSLSLSWLICCFLFVYFWLSSFYIWYIPYQSHISGDH